MNIQIISFTRAGAELSQILQKKLYQENISLITKYTGAEKREVPILEISLQEWTKNAFISGAAILFIGACGIAVRSVAPFIKSKSTDPAIIVMDEKGMYAIPILSGHIGQANALAIKFAEITGGQAVLTTATDVNRLFAVDVFANVNALFITDIIKAKRISAIILQGHRIPLFYQKDFLEVQGTMPDELQVTELPDKDFESSTMPDLFGLGILITPYVHQTECLQLIPRVLYLGIGCRRGKEAKEILELVESILEENHFSAKSISKIVSIDLKKEEPGIQSAAEVLGVPFETFCTKVLKQVPGDFCTSAFVESTTGVDNVCERAVMAAGADRLLVNKIGRNGITLAIGYRKGKINFE